MKKSHISQTASWQAAGSPKNRFAAWLPALCVMAVLGIVVSMMLLGSNLERFSASDAYAIPLVPDTFEANAADADAAGLDVAVTGDASSDDASGEAAAARDGATAQDASDPTTTGSSAADRSPAGENASDPSHSAPSNSAAPAGTDAAANPANPTNPASSDPASQADPASSDPANSDPAEPAGSDPAEPANPANPAASAASAGADPANPADSAAPATSDQAKPDAMHVTDHASNVWRTETEIDLFKDSYGDAVASSDGSKLLAPGTTNSYDFMLKNNVDVPLAYVVSLRVDAWVGSAADAGASADAGATSIPLEWRLLAADKTPVSDWQLHGSTVDKLDSATLEAGRQAGYTIEWRWAFERDASGSADGGPTGADTASGSTDVADATAAADAADTAQGNRAALEDFGVKATVFVTAEQVTDDPDNPKDPDDNPDDPGDNPDNPDDNPDNPVKPDNPSNPSNPDDPNNPDTPKPGASGPDASKPLDAPKNLVEAVVGLLPQTGDATLALVVACLIAVATGAAFVLVAVRRKHAASQAQAQTQTHGRRR